MGERSGLQPVIRLGKGCPERFVQSVEGLIVAMQGLSQHSLYLMVAWYEAWVCGLHGLLPCAGRAFFKRQTVQDFCPAQVEMAFVPGEKLP